MKKTTLSNKHHLATLLKIVAAESVSKARVDLQQLSDDERKRQLDTAESIGSLGKPTKKEKPVEEDEKQQGEKPPPVPGGPDVKASAQPVEKSSEPLPTAEPEEDADASSVKPHPKIDISFAMIKEKLNTIRSGRSLRDREIRQNLKDYFKGLDEEEKESLYSFLDGIGAILTAGIEPEQASEPDKSPHHVEMYQDEDEEDETEDNASDMNDEDEDEEDDEIVSQNRVKHQQHRPIRKKKRRKVRKQRSPGGEDTSPPIEVGVQKTEALRRHVRSLME